MGKKCDSLPVGDGDAAIALPAERGAGGEARGGFSREGSDTIETVRGRRLDNDDDDDGADEASDEADDVGESRVRSDAAVAADSSPALSCLCSVPSFGSSPLTKRAYAACDSHTCSSAGAHSGGMQNKTSPKLALVRRSVGAAVCAAGNDPPKSTPLNIEAAGCAGCAGGDGDAGAAADSRVRADDKEEVCSGRCDCNCCITVCRLVDGTPRRTQ